ncbi:hypothetical protein GJ744_001935 [Endocarpon pusillum]|uniref:Retrotransposon gag domain-containing protein n=1 Tax=Endocarpon pusillum TaxID=364733 RepID=A0A8H7E7Q6_9EURO|nr:hypothetical protein GJ744_001935 [Endocarpon pusillum]
MELQQLKQSATLQEYVTKFELLKGRYEAAGGDMTKMTVVGIFVAGLTPQLSHEAFAELARQGNGEPDMVALK